MNSDNLPSFLMGEAEAFEQWAAPLTDLEFAERPNGRWSVGDTAQHLYLSARPVLRLMAGPREVFAQWDRAVEPSRTYEAIEETYRRVLSRGVKAPVSMSPRPEDVAADKATMLARVTDTYRALADQVVNWSAEEMDSYQIPHPALGLISVREMMYFIGVHTRHHIAVLEAY
jgi:hypothetical protein